MNTLCKNILNSQYPIIFYELIPPAEGIRSSSMNAYVQCAIEILAHSAIEIDAINIPEIHNENNHGNQDAKRTSPYVPKIEPREFVRLLQEASTKPLNFVINRATVYATMAQQQTWLAETLSQYPITSLILVGGESSRTQYEGPSVTELAAYIQQHYAKQICCGGITIPSRRHQNPQKDEPYRLIAKSKQHLEFFTSQILYETNSIKRLLHDYHRLCRQHAIQPKRIFLSFAPILTANDVNFLRWLGVEIPVATERYLLESELGIGWRSIKTTKAVLEDILTFVHDEQLDVPIGLNIEHITPRNFELSKELIVELGRIYKSFFH